MQLQDTRDLGRPLHVTDLALKRRSDIPDSVLLRLILALVALSVVPPRWTLLGVAEPFLSNPSCLLRAPYVTIDQMPDDERQSRQKLACDNMTNSTSRALRTSSKLGSWHR